MSTFENYAFGLMVGSVAIALGLMALQWVGVG
jgi:hypothetical protein